MHKGAVLQSLRTLLVAFALGVLIWYIARTEIISEEQVEVAVRVVSAADCRVEGETGGPPRVSLLLTGPTPPLQRARDSVQRDKGFVRLELTGEQLAREGLLRVPATQLELKSLPDRRVRLRLLDREVPLVVTPLAKRMKRVRLVTDLDPSRYQVRGQMPHDVEVLGPKTLVDRLAEVETEPLRLREIADAGRPDFQTYIEVAKVIDGQRIECEPRSVYVDIVFGEKMATKKFKDVPVQYVAETGFPYEVKIEPGQRTAVVEIQGPRSVIGNPEIRDQIVVFVKIGSSLKPSDTPYLIERQHLLPKGVELVRISVPEKVSVDILERKAPASGPP